MKMMIRAIIIFSLSCGCWARIPDFIQPCDTLDPKCLTAAAQRAVPGFVQGMPEYDIPSLDPFVSEPLNMSLSNVVFSLYNGKALGLRKCHIVLVKVLENEDRILVNFRCDLTIKGQYKAKGRILLFDIDGEGDAKVKIRDLGIKLNIKYKVVADDRGVDHFVVKNYKYQHEFGGRMSFDIQNLFKNDPELSKSVLNIMNESWRLLADEFGRPILDYCMSTAMKYVSKFYDNVPARELFGPNVAWPLKNNEQ